MRAQIGLGVGEELERAQTAQKVLADVAVAEVPLALLRDRQVAVLAHQLVEKLALRVHDAGSAPHERSETAERRQEMVGGGHHCRLPKTQVEKGGFSFILFITMI
eukprot:scaffold2618_cov240-Pinguiococcus_pyrenoidosus.AAC.11